MNLYFYKLSIVKRQEGESKHIIHLFYERQQTSKQVKLQWDILNI